MLKKYLFYICLLSNNLLFAVIELKMPSSKQVLNQKNSQYPSGFKVGVWEGKKYGDLDTAIQTIIDYLWPNKGRNINVHMYNEPSIGKCMILKPDLTMLSQDSTLSPFTFVWKKKQYKGTKDLERKIADYYSADAKSDIEFLYSYNFFHSDPWAIKIGNQLHATLWVEGKKVESDGIGSHRSSTLQNSLQDSFLVLDPKDRKATVNFLIDENNRIIAKRINEIITFRNK